VKRTLVGVPGITYKYLNIRLFAHPWCGADSSPMMNSICKINDHMIQLTRKHADQADVDHGSCDYNLTLINYMEPTSHTKVGFKEEAFYDMGKVSVSWHSDSSLEDNSSIGVCHFLPARKKARCDWRIAMRPSPSNANDSNTAPPIAVSTADGDAYFLLGGFNEKYQHCVLAGSSLHRISSTHRVANTDKDTFQYISRRARTALKRFRLELEKDETNMDYRVFRFCCLVHTEIEMEWIAQYWLQGVGHNAERIWWQKPMSTLERLWNDLEDLTCRLFNRCVESSIQLAIIDALLDEFKERRRQRILWDERRADKVYQKRMSEQFRPIPRPQFSGKKDQLDKDLSAAIRQLSNIKVTREKGKATKKQLGQKGSQNSRMMSPTRKKKRLTYSRTKEGGNKRNREK